MCKASTTMYDVQCERFGVAANRLLMRVDGSQSNRVFPRSYSTFITHWSVAKMLEFFYLHSQLSRDNTKQDKVCFATAKQRVQWLSSLRALTPQRTNSRELRHQQAAGIMSYSMLSSLLTDSPPFADHRSGAAPVVLLLAECWSCAALWF